MIVFKTKEQRDAERKQHKDLTFCIECYSCRIQCGRTTVEEYRKYLKENNHEDPWDVDRVVTEDRGSGVQERETDSDEHTEKSSNEES